MNHYTSMQHALRVIYPEIPWEAIKAPPPKPPRKDWRSSKRVRDFFQRIEKDLGVKEVKHCHNVSYLHSNKLKDWYAVPRKKVIAKGGKGLFNHYETFEKALKAAYPEYPWQASGFVDAGRTPPGHWKDNAHLLEALTLAEQRIGISKV